MIKGFPPKEDPKLSFEGNKVHTLLKLFQGESSKQDSVKFEEVVFYKPPPCKIHNSPLIRGLHLLPPSALPRESKHASPREKERESVANLIRGSYNGPQYIVTLQSPESVAKHSISVAFNVGLLRFQNCINLDIFFFFLNLASFA